MIWWLSVFSTTWAPVTRPVLSSSTFTSGMFSSSAPLASRRWRRIMASVCIRPSRSQTLPPSLRRQASRVGQELIDLLVGQPLAAADGRRVQLGRDPQALGRELHDGRLRVADLARLKARQAVGDHLRQHGQHAVGQIDARGPLQGLAVQAPSSGRTKCDTSAMWTPSRQWPLSSRSSEMASSKSRASTGSMVTIVSPVKSVRPPIDSSNASACRRASSSASSANAVGQVELADDRQRVDARLAPRAEHLGDHALRRRAAARGSGPSR